MKHARSCFSGKMLLPPLIVLLLGLIVTLASNLAASADDTATTPSTESTGSASGDDSQTSTPPADDAKKEKPSEAALAVFRIDNLWVLISAFLVFIMHLGFATVESGLSRQKNTVNILFKNVFIVCIGIVTYYLVGFKLHYPGVWWDAASGSIASEATWNGIFASNVFSTWPIAGLPKTIADQTIGYNGEFTYWTDFLFQAMFAATAATIVSGAVAERVKIGSFMIYATLLVAFAYPIAGCWVWGTGILSKAGFHDFAGSTMVHGFGGAAALACVLVLGPRKGKYTPSGPKAFLGSSMPLATIGVMLLWLGWFGFNGGSVLSADPDAISLVSVTTTLAAAGGALASTATSWIFLRKPDLSMALNGILAGLVGITAGANIIPPPYALLTGALAGSIVVFAIVLLDRIRIDDPVGAISVHGVCGIFGTLCCAFFGEKDLIVQLSGVGLVCGFSFVFSLVLFLILKFTIGVRVSEEVEFAGLDVHEHGAPAYSLE